MTARATFKQSDIERACKGVTGAGLPVARVRVSPEGFIDIIISEESGGVGIDGPNPMDRILDGQAAPS